MYSHINNNSPAVKVTLAKIVKCVMHMAHMGELVGVWVESDIHA